jgi:glycosyltransferase involved in cell wall biosynthesis
MTNTVKIALLLPAHNEESTIIETIESFDMSLSGVNFAIIDNGSTDQTRTRALSAIGNLKNNVGILLIENSLGKSNAIRKGFRTVEADIYLMCDADSTYTSSDASLLIAAIRDLGYDMAVADRHSGGDYSLHNTRKLHDFGNKLIQNIVNRAYGSNLKDILSGFRAFSADFVHSYPITVTGFELETDLTLHALDKRLSIKEIQSGYKERPSGSNSKLNTYKDGARIIRLIVRVLRYYKPILFFNFFGAIFTLIAILFGAKPINDYVTNQFVEHVPLAILALGTGIIGILLFLVGIVLDALNNTNRRMFSLSQVTRNGTRQTP